MHPLSHEISEWADDPFVNNSVEPWQTPTAPQYGCSDFLETGDPVVGIGFAIGKNTFEQGPNPNGTQSADGYYHPEDEVHLRWFMRLSPNTVSEPTQSASTNIGRYTFMGDLNPFPGFRQPARVATRLDAKSVQQGPRFDWAPSSTRARLLRAAYNHCSRFQAEQYRTMMATIILWQLGYDVSGR